MEVGVRKFRDELRHWLDEVENGREITITDRGKPVARLITAGKPTALERLIAQGIVTPAKSPKRPSRYHRKIRAKGSVSEFLSEQRR